MGSIDRPGDIMGGSTVTCLLRSKLRQVPISARTFMSINRPPQPLHQQSDNPPPYHQAHQAVASGLDTMQTVDLTDVLIQVPGSIRAPLMSDEDFQLGVDEYERVEGEGPGDDERPTIGQ